MYSNDALSLMKFFPFCITLVKTCLLYTSQVLFLNNIFMHFKIDVFKLNYYKNYCHKETKTDMYYEFIRLSNKIY